MKHTGIIRRVDDLGRVVLPKEVRRIMCIGEGEPLEIFPDVEKQQIVLRKYDAIEPLESIACLMYALLESSQFTDCGNVLRVKVGEIEAILKAEREKPRSDV